MKKTVLTFGPIGGAIMATIMFATLPFVDKIGVDKGEIIGYTTMIVAFMLFFGIRSYRENVSGGHITFGRAFAVGILITLVASGCLSLPGRSFTSNSCRTLRKNTRAT